MSQQGWSEDDSVLYARIAPIAVPRRAEQMAVLAASVPFKVSDRFRILELASGEGRFAQTLLHLFPEAELLALDGSSEMRAATERALEGFGGRAEVGEFDIYGTDWFAHLEEVDVVVSSLCIHHLDDDAKRSLFGEVSDRISDRGALLIADLVQPRGPRSTAIQADLWDRDARSQAETHGTPELYESFLEVGWNLWSNPDPEFDKPSTLLDQLRWLEAVGLMDVDCFWLYAGHAVYGGFKGERPATGIDLGDALEAARRALS